MEYQTISASTPAPALQLITLKRPEAANALNQRMAEELAHAVGAAEKNNAVRVIVLTGAGERAFCAGADLKERVGMNKAQWQAQHHAFETALAAIMNCTKPIIAAVNGAAFGGGLELALACDFIYASHNANFGLTETTLGIMPGMGGVQTLARAAGIARAKELMFTGKKFSAQEALEWGVVNRVCADALTEAISAANVIANNAPLALSNIKNALLKHSGLPLGEAISKDLTLYNALLETRDRTEGINAFNEKRKAVFRGE